MNLKDLRKANKLSQADVARGVEVDQTAVSYWERGKTGVCKKHRKRLCYVYDCSEEELLAAIEETRREANNLVE